MARRTWAAGTALTYRTFRLVKGELCRERLPAVGEDE